LAVDATRAEVTAWSCLVRLATGLGDRRASRRMRAQALRHWRWLANDPAADAYAVADALLAIDMVLADTALAAP
jgi:hypothetical protein